MILTKVMSNPIGPWSELAGGEPTPSSTNRPPAPAVCRLMGLHYVLLPLPDQDNTGEQKEKSIGFGQ